MDGLQLYLGSQSRISSQVFNIDFLLLGAVSSSAASIRSQLAQVPSHEYGDVARVSAPPAAARSPGRRRSAGSPRTHSCRLRHDNGTAATLGSFDIDVFRNSQCSGQLRLVPCLLLGDGSLNPQVDRKVDRHLIQIF